MANFHQISLNKNRKFLIVEICPKCLDLETILDIDYRTKVNFYISTITPLPLPPTSPPPPPSSMLKSATLPAHSSTLILGGGGKVGLSGNQCPRLSVKKNLKTVIVDIYTYNTYTYTYTY